MDIPTKDLFRRLNALVRTSAQRNHIVAQIQLNNGANLDARYDGFDIIANRLIYNMPNGDAIPVLMSQQDVTDAIKAELAKDSNVGKGINNMYWFLKFKFLNIIKDDVQKHLQGNEAYVLAQKPKARVNQSIVT